VDLKAGTNRPEEYAASVFKAELLNTQVYAASVFTRSALVFTPVETSNLKYYINFRGRPSKVQ
jgi:hypothetical protein